MYAVFYAWKCSYGLVCCAVTKQQCLMADVCVTAPASCFDTVAFVVLGHSRVVSCLTQQWWCIVF